MHTIDQKQQCQQAAYNVNAIVKGLGIITTSEPTKISGPELLYSSVIGERPVLDEVVINFLGDLRFVGVALRLKVRRKQSLH